MKFDVDAQLTSEGIVDVFAIIELQDGTRTRWTCGGLDPDCPPLAGQWNPIAYPADGSAEESLLRLR